MEAPTSTPAAPAAPAASRPAAEAVAPARQLNVKDALSYLDQVKVQFSDSPGVYNQFLDIMKDFKTQYIDTPGVIHRVSSLFRGHPTLIEGFNTFLPPGYHIEVETPKDGGPTAYSIITVTHPQGTQTQSKLSLHAGGPDEPIGNQHSLARPSGGSIRLGSLPPPAAADTPLATPGASIVLGMQTNGAAVRPDERGPKPLEFNHAISYVNKIKNRYANDAHTYQTFLEILQRYQRDTRPLNESFPQVYEQVNQLFRGAPDLLAEFMQFLPDPAHHNAAVGIAGARPEPVPGAPSGSRRKPDGPGIPYADGRGAGEGPSPPKKKRAPVPGSTTAPPARTVGGEIEFAPLDEHGMPIAPPPPAPGPPRGTKRKQRAPKAEVAALPSANLPPPAFALPGYPTLGAAYYAMQEANAKGARALPRVIAAREELTFFQHVKEHVGERKTYIEFLKLVNLFTQDAIDLAALVHRAKPFLAGSPELYARFKDILGWRDGVVGPRGVVVEDGVRVIENVPSAAPLRPDLSGRPQCGPSYRKLPEADVSLNCTGRDALCWSVLNDHWVCAPSAHSLAEDHAFIVKQTNAFERALFQAEDERHEYDYHIEANNRTIALLEPINVRIQQMEPEARLEYRLKPGLGSSSKSIYQRIIKKVYGKEQGADVIQALHENPVLAVPIVLARLKQKDDEWKRALREWNRVWREVDAKNYWKALDHQGLTFKAADKKALSQKSLVSEVDLIKREQQQRRIANGREGSEPAYQMELEVEDQDVLFDALRLLIHFLDSATAAGLDDELKDKIEFAVRRFVPLFFNISPSLLDLQLTPLPPDRQQKHPVADGPGLMPMEGRETPLSDGEGSDTGITSAFDEDRPARPKRRGPGATAGDLRKKAMRNAGAPTDRAARRAEAESRGVSPAPSSSAADELLSTTSAVVESRPVEGGGEVKQVDPVVAEVSSLREEDRQMEIDGEKRTIVAGSLPAVLTAERSDADGDSVMQDAPTIEVTVKPPTPPEPVRSTSGVPKLARVNFIANNSWYGFVRLVQLFYSRLATLKAHATSIVADDGSSPLTVMAPKMNPAGPSSLVQKQLAPQLPAPVETPSKPSEYYPALLALVQAFNAGEMEPQAFEEGCRILFPTKGYLLSTVDKVCQALIKLLSKIALDEASMAILRLFEDQRHLETTGKATPAQRLAYRRSVEDNTGGYLDSNVFRLEWVPALRHVRVQLASRDEIAPEDVESVEKQWAAYTDSWSDVLTLPTLGLEDLKVTPPLLQRNLAAASKGAKQADPSLFDSQAELGIRVCMRSYRLFFVPGTEDFLARRLAPSVPTSSLRDDEPAVTEGVTSARSETAATEARGRRKAKWDSILEKLVEKAELGSRQKPVEVVASPTPAPPAEDVQPLDPDATASAAAAAPDVPEVSTEVAHAAIEAPVPEPAVADATV